MNIFWGNNNKIKEKTSIIMKLSLKQYLYILRCIYPTRCIVQYNIYTANENVKPILKREREAFLHEMTDTPDHMTQK